MCREGSLPGLRGEARPALQLSSGLRQQCWQCCCPWEGCGAGVGCVPWELMALLLFMAQGPHPVCSQHLACPGGQKCLQGSLCIK